MISAFGNLVFDVVESSMAFTEILIQLSLVSRALDNLRASPISAQASPGSHSRCCGKRLEIDPSSRGGSLASSLWLAGGCNVDGRNACLHFFIASECQRTLSPKPKCLN